MCLSWFFPVLGSSWSSLNSFKVRGLNLKQIKRSPQAKVGLREKIRQARVLCWLLQLLFSLWIVQLNQTLFWARLRQPNGVANVRHPIATYLVIGAGAERFAQ
jgi:hypothetical protein